MKASLIAMRRRDFVKAIVAVPITANTMFGQTVTAQHSEKTSAPQSNSTAAAPPLPETAPTSVERPESFNFRTQPIATVVPDVFAKTEEHFFDAGQMETLRKLSDILIPPFDGYPGAIQAGAPEF